VGPQWGVDQAVATVVDGEGAVEGEGDVESVAMGSVVVEQHDDVRWLWLNRPRRRNALDPELAQALAVAVEAAADDARTAVLVIAGRGPSFCAGADLRHLHELAVTGGDPLPFLSGLSATFSRIESLPKPVVAAVHGHVVAGGLELALACDVVVARTGTMIGDGHVRNGLLPAAGASLRLPRKVGEPLAAWLMLTGDLLPAEEFIASGFVHAVASEAEFPGVLAATVDRLRATTGSVHRRVKQLLAAGRDSADEALAAELAVFGDHWRDAATDTREALRRFLDGRG
jgi:enoyl-CoA hydratase/carnithine racemase